MQTGCTRRWSSYRRELGEAERREERRGEERRGEERRSGGERARRSGSERREGVEFVERASHRIINTVGASEHSWASTVPLLSRASLQGRRGRACPVAERTVGSHLPPSHQAHCPRARHTPCHVLRCALACWAAQHKHRNPIGSAYFCSPICIKQTTSTEEENNCMCFPCTLNCMSDRPTKRHRAPRFFMRLFCKSTQRCQQLASERPNVSHG